MVLAAGKFLISEEVQNKKFEVVKTILEAITGAIKAPVSGSVDTKRLALVVVRTLSRVHFEVNPPSDQQSYYGVTHWYSGGSPMTI